MENSKSDMKVKKREVECCNGIGIEEDDGLDQISEFKRGDGYIEVRCGCTSPKYGDSVGRLIIYNHGEFRVICECSPGCDEGKLTPAAFERHSGRENARKWKNNIWVIIDGEKVPISRTSLLKYYGNGTRNGRHSKQFNHRDEFIRCKKCNKERRFKLRNKEECRIYHDACKNPNWECSDLPYDRIGCLDDEERLSRKTHRGCPRNATCEGCTSCVCFGCCNCRFTDCDCQTCVDFILNAK